MAPSGGVQRRSSPADIPPDEVTPEEKLICLGSWLERTTLKEAQAAQACSILPASTLTIGAAFAGAFIGIDHRWSALLVFLVFAIAALALFLYHHRRWSVWKSVAIRLQDEQMLIIGPGRTKALAKAGRHAPEKLAAWYGGKIPLRFLSGPTMALYLAAFVLGMTLLVFAVSKDYDWLRPKEAAATEAPATDAIGPATPAGKRALF